MSHGPRSSGTGAFRRADLRACADSCVLEAGVRIFGAANVSLAAKVYIGHDTLIHGYIPQQGSVIVGEGTWIGPQCYLHGAGGICIESEVGIGPGVKIFSSQHREVGREVAIRRAPLAFEAVRIGSGADLGVGVVVLPGVRIGVGVLVGAGAVVTTSLPDFAVAVGVPARVIRYR